MNKRKIVITTLLSLCTAAAGFFSVGCDGDSAETAIRNVLINVTGFYQGIGEATRLVEFNTGNPVTSMDLRQAGDKLEGVDNNGIIFKGSIGRADENVASFTLNGRTTVGNGATISGSITINGNDAQMQGSWIEDGLFSTVAGMAVVPNQPVIDPQNPSNDTTVVVYTIDRQPTNPGSPIGTILSILLAIIALLGVLTLTHNSGKTRLPLQEAV